MSLAPGTCLGPYTIENRLASGGMGAVYRALDTRLGRRVALKVLLPTFAVDPERLKRFQQEAQATSTLRLRASMIAAPMSTTAISPNAASLPR